MLPVYTVLWMKINVPFSSWATTHSKSCTLNNTFCTVCGLCSHYGLGSVPRAIKISNYITRLHQITVVLFEAAVFCLILVIRQLCSSSVCYSFSEINTRSCIHTRPRLLSPEFGVFNYRPSINLILLVLGSCQIWSLCVKQYRHTQWRSRISHYGSSRGYY